MDNLPHSIYYIAGILVLSNLGVIIAVATFIFKAGMFVSETRTGIDDAKKSSVRAHKRIDEALSVRKNN